MALVNVGFEYAKAWIEGTITERNDAEALNNLFAQTYGEGVAPSRTTPTPKAPPSTTTTP